MEPNEVTRTGMYYVPQIEMRENQSEDTGDNLLDNEAVEELLPRRCRQRVDRRLTGDRRRLPRRTWSSLRIDLESEGLAAETPLPIGDVGRRSVAIAGDLLQRTLRTSQLHN